MEDEPAAPPTSKVPEDDEIKRIFEAYALAVGKVAHSWNYLHEALGQLFAAVLSAPNRGLALAVWYSTDSDRTQRNMLRAAVSSSGEGRWQPRLPKAFDDLIWLLD